MEPRKASQPKYRIGDIVYHDNKAWFVTGCSMKLGYDLYLWECHLSRSLYSADDDPGCPWMAREDASQTVVREDEVTTAKSHHQKKLAEARAAVDKAQEELDRMRDEVEELENATESGPS